jgi:hypothetical protein
VHRIFPDSVNYLMNDTMASRNKDCAFLLRTVYGCVCTRAVCKVRGLNLLLRVGTLWRCGDGLFFEVPPLPSGCISYNSPPTSRERAADR